MNNGQIELGEATTLQNDNPVVEKKYVLPQPKSTGANLNAEAAADEKLAEKKEKEAPEQSFASGGMAIQATVNGVYAEQRTGRGDEWFQCYYFSLEFKNPEDAALTIANTSVQYQAKDGTWVSPKNENIHCGSHNGYFFDLSYGLLLE